MRSLSFRSLAGPLLCLASACASGANAAPDEGPTGGLPTTTGGSGGAVGATSGGAAGSGGSSGSGGSNGGSGGSGGSSSSGSSGGSGGSGGGSGSSGGSSSGAAGTAGAAGAGAASGSAGTTSAAGTGGAGMGAAGNGSTAGGAAGTSATGGAGGAGTAGTGGVGVAIVVLAAQGASNALGAVFTESNGWSTVAAPMAVTGRPSIGVIAGTPIAVARIGGMALMQSTWTGTTFTSFTPLPTSPTAIDGPSLAGSSAGAALAYLETGAGLYLHKVALWNGSGFSAPGQLGGDGTPAFGLSSASIARAGQSTWAAYSGADEGLYTTHHDGLVWTNSMGVPAAGTKSDISPAIALAPDGHPFVAYVRNSDSAVCLTQNPGAGWSAPKCIAAALTTRSPGLAVTKAGAPIVVWHGYNDEGIYAADMSAASPSVINVDKTAGTAGAPVVVTGMPGADADIVYAKGLHLRHVRVVSSAVTMALDVGGTAATEVAAAVQ